MTKYTDYNEFQRHYFPKIPLTTGGLIVNDPEFLYTLRFDNLTISDGNGCSITLIKKTYTGNEVFDIYQFYMTGRN
jgi:hypothetical protein